MKAMIWKEMRENLRWALLAAVALGLGYAYVLSQAFSSYERYNPYGDYGSQGIPLPTAITSPLVGLLLGLLQIMPELRRDQWAFLLHRPVPRATLFWGKVGAGLFLYLLATVPPFVLTMLWFTTPGRVAAPVDWRLALPGAIDTLAGTIFYLAGILTAVRPARWFGSRALPIALAAVCMFLVTTGCNELWQALAVIGVGTAIVLVAARGSFLTSGDYNGQPQLARAALGTTLFTGGAAATITAVTMLLSMASSLVSSPSPRSEWTSYEINEAGQVYRITRDGNAIKSMIDLQGRKLPIPEVDRNGAQSHPEARALPEQMVVPQYDEYLDRNISYRNATRYYTFIGEQAGKQRGTRWFYDKSKSVVVGYWSDNSAGPLNRHLRGYVTPDGFVPAGQPRDGKPLTSFPGRLMNWVYGWGEMRTVLSFPNVVYLVTDFDNPQIVRITEAKPGLPFRGAMATRSGANPGEVALPGIVVVATDTQVQGFSRDARLLFTLERKKSKRQEYKGVRVSVSRKVDRVYVWEDPKPATGKSEMMPTFVTEVRLATPNAPRRQYRLPPLDREVPGPDSSVALTGLLVPPAITGGIIGYAAIGGARGNAEAARMWSDMGADKWMYLMLSLFSLLSGLVSATLAWLIGRRCAFPAKGRWAWAVGTFLLGPFGVLTLLSLRDWPARETCPGCGKRRVVTNERCEHCGAGFPAPVRDGTEIFEPVL